MERVVWLTESVVVDSVPLGREYLANGGKPLDETTVRTVIKNSTGLLLVGDKFKGLVFSNRKQYRQLIEALTSYIAKPETAGMLIIRVEPNGYITAGVTWLEERSHYWTYENECYRFLDSSETVTDGANPFIRPGTPAVTVSSPIREEKPNSKSLPKK